MSILFLDIDGVLNSHKWFEHLIANPREGDHFDRHIDPEAMYQLNRVCSEAMANVVVSSTWRKVYNQAALRIGLRKAGFAHTVIGVTPSHGFKYRGDEISHWLTENGHRNHTFAIVDDDSDMGGLLPRLVKTRFDTGLTTVEADLLIEMLNE
jgi:hypothetical protein